ncbi:MAG: undecaprenyl-diphosphatase [Caulobacter vibrioides]|jgi:undecaprenyl-diphosphatase|uniref:Undecaprenyl-diphosphatase n=1 Tax=Caulobacter vibrioides TaxID=155892 RepID=A0A258DBH4_CAUVI|nr:undecaprenyl-diphosphate phosphatase [Caulobacter vibrioides]ATC33757.1 undecaprenyl-diphosphate phosphatase [Caulobacter vibrioides]OYX05305.1 MAG: undecaprenyl-diphosphatase [Caulobacter vibrioides]
MPDWLIALILGLIEGLTEFIPVSSTGHLLLVGHFLGFHSPGNTFQVLIQLGAILAITSVYFGRLWGLLTTLPTNPGSRRFVMGVFLAFLPAVLVGVLAHDYIKTVLYESPTLICTTLIIGGVILLGLDRMKFEPRHTDVADYPLKTAFLIGLFQCIALVPGVSRSGATIAGALLLKCDKRSAAEFSFFLAMPTMAGAFAYDLYKNIDKLSTNDLGLIAVGFVAALVSGVFVVKTVLDFITRHGFAPFAWWRIVVGFGGLALLYIPR